MKLPKYVVTLSILGTTAGSLVLLKDYMSGCRYSGKERIPGKTVIITGANTGIGKETAKELARRGGRVILGCRDLEKGEMARNEIVLETANQNVEVKLLNLASIGSIRAFAKDINASHFLLTMLLLDKLKRSQPSRIINVSSIGHRMGKINFDDLNSTEKYDPLAAYTQSKLANVLFTRELATRLQGTSVTANALHPGIVRTELGRHMSIEKTFIYSFLFAPLKWLLMKSPIQGSQTTLYCALSPELEGVSGKYFSDCKEKEVAEQARDEAAAKRLWAISEKWTGLA